MRHYIAINLLYFLFNHTLSISDDKQKKAHTNITKQQQQQQISYK